MRASAVIRGLDAGEERRALIGCCRDAAAAAVDRRCLSRAAEAIGGRRCGLQPLQPIRREARVSLSEVLNQTGAGVKKAAAAEMGVGVGLKCGVWGVDPLPPPR